MMHHHIHIYMPPDGRGMQSIPLKDFGVGEGDVVTITVHQLPSWILEGAGWSFMFPGGFEIAIKGAMKAEKDARVKEFDERRFELGG